MKPHRHLVQGSFSYAFTWRLRDWIVSHYHTEINNSIPYNLSQEVDSWDPQQHYVSVNCEGTMYARVINIFFRFFSKYSTTGRMKASAVGWRKIQIGKKIVSDISRWKGGDKGKTWGKPTREKRKFRTHAQYTSPTDRKQHARLVDSWLSII